VTETYGQSDDKTREAGGTVTGSEPDQQSALLRAITNLAAFHREHEKFYASAPRELAVTLQRHARTLQALADRWSTVSPAHPVPFSPFEGAEDLNDPAALQLDGVLFMEGEGEPAEITQIKRDLRTAADANIAVGDWLTSAMGTSWEVATALLDIPELADLLGERHRIIANDWHAASMSALAGRVPPRASHRPGATPRRSSSGTRQIWRATRPGSCTTTSGGGGCSAPARSTWSMVPPDARRARHSVRPSARSRRTERRTCRAARRPNARRG
jgi:hypothetical protein